MNKKYVRIMWSVLALFVIVILIYTIFVMPREVREGFKSLEENMPSTYILTSNDSGLISEKYRPRIRVNEVYNSKVRGPLSVLSFDSLYRIVNYKIELTNDVSLNSLLFTNIESAHQSVGYSYKIAGIGAYFEYRIKAGLVKPVSQVFLTLCGDSLINTNNNDSILSYHLVCKNISIRYGENQPLDIFIEGSDFGLGRIAITAMEVLLLKRKRSLYFSILLPINTKTNVPSELLNDIVLGKL